MAAKSVKKVVLAYSGGLDTSCIVPWLVENYRNSFAQEIGASGIDGLIAKLAEKNKAAAGRA